MKFYNKHYLKKNPETGEVLVEDGKPVFGEIAKAGCPLEDVHIKVLNRSWRKTGIFFAEVESEPQKSDARIALEEEAKELGIKYRENIGDEKLQEKIKNAIEN